MLATTWGSSVRHDDEGAWLQRALCRGKRTWYDDSECDPELVRPTCDRCPVRARCLEEALDYEADTAISGRFGIWAGLTPAQRISAEKRGAIRCPVCSTPFDPRLVRSGIVRCPASAEHCDRVLEPIPDDGDNFSRRQLAIAKQLTAAYGVGDRVPRPHVLAARWGAPLLDVQRAVVSLVLEGAVLKVGRGHLVRTAIEGETPVPVPSAPKRHCDYCDKPHLARGMCAAHYKAWQRAGMPTLTEGLVGA